MIHIRINCIFFSTLVIICSVISIFAQTNTLDRDKEPVILLGQQVPGLIGSESSDIYLYKYDSSGQNWVQIPLQIDDVGTDKSYFSESDGIIDIDDEIVFMALDVGDKAPDDHWIHDIDSQNYPRHQILVTDPTDPTKRGWVYLYQSETLTTSFSADYVNYVSGEISSDAYQLQHNSSHGFLENALITAGGGGTGVNIIDREKIRIKGQIGVATYEMTEDALNLSNDQYIDGPVRVLREMQVSLGYGTETMTKSISERYYRYSSVTGGSIGTIQPSYGVTYMRQSLDLNSNANGMSFSNNNNTNIPIDGASDAGINSGASVNGSMWSLISGTQGSMIQLLYLPDIGNPQQLYYYDSSSGGTADPTIPPLTDSGDNQSFGDIGIYFENPNAQTFALGYTRYFLPANQPASTGSIFESYYNNPLTPSVTVQTPSPTDSVSARIINPRVNGNEFLWDIEINRLDDWGTANEQILGDHVLVFSINPNGFSSLIPTIESTAGIFISNPNYQLSTFSPQASQCAVEIDYANNGGTDFYPPLNTWSYVFTLSLSIADANQSSGLDWSNDNTHFMKAAPQVLEDILEGSGNIPLPIELSSFSAVYENGTIRLMWRTETESQNMGFHLFRSLRKEDGYTRITGSLIIGAGNSETPNVYQFIDGNIEKNNTYYYKMASVDYNGNLNFYPPIETTTMMPDDYDLLGNYPNPFNPETRIKFMTSQGGFAELNIYNYLGQKVRTLLSGYIEQGQHQVKWNGRDDTGQILPNGMYICTLSINGYTDSHKMMLLK